MTNLFETDENEWLNQQVALLEAGKLAEIDRENLMSYLAEMASRDRRELGNRLVVLLQHLLKFHFQPEKRSSSWLGTIMDQQDQINDIFEVSPSIKTYVPDLFIKAYPRAVRKASSETGLDKSKFPATCPWTIEDCLSFDPR